jgi:NhaP-type Na+/H+ or K+/H+ antiporter
MAFKIFGEVAAEHKTGELAQLLCGPHGIGSLAATLAFVTQPTEHSYHGRHNTKCIRLVEGICTALMSACVHGLTQQVVEHGLCPSLVTLVEIL